MNHEPVSAVIAWLKGSPVNNLVSGRVASLFDESVTLPAIAVTNARGFPVSTAGGMDTVYDWQVTIYALAGKTGRGNDYPDFQAAATISGEIVQACRTVAGGVHYVLPSGAKIIDAEVFSMARTTDANGDATVVMTVDVRLID